MAIEETISLAAAARIVGVHRRTLRAWLRVDLGIVFGPPKRGAVRLVRRVDVEKVQRLHCGHQDLSLFYPQRRKVRP